MFIFHHWFALGQLIQVSLTSEITSRSFCYDVVGPGLYDRATKMQDTHVAKPRGASRHAGRGIPLIPPAIAKVRLGRGVYRSTFYCIHPLRT
jgi:hypothetical protein